MSVFDDLTAQEHKVLALLAQGKRNAAIACELTISVRTVETHLYRIFDKLGVSTRIEAVLYVLRHLGEPSLLLTAEVSGNSDDTATERTYSQR